MISLFNGNFILDKRCEQFLNWLKNLNLFWELGIEAKPFHLEISLENGWLSGFCDADAGFYTNVKTNFRGDKKSQGGYYIKFVPKFYVTQKDEFCALQQILDLFGNKSKKIAKITNGRTSVLYNRIEIHSEESSDKIFSYFQRFPLKSNRKIDYCRWVRVHLYKKMHVVPTEKAATKLVRLLLSIEEPSYIEVENTDSAFSLSEEEILIFQNLPKSQRHPDYEFKKNQPKEKLVESPPEKRRTRKKKL